MSLPARMSGVLLTRHGGPEVLVWRDDLPVPAPGPGEVTVRVTAAGVNNTDLNTRIGWYAKDDPEAGGWDGALAFPRIQGSDLCGIVAASDDPAFRPGMRVTCATIQPEPAHPNRYIAIGSEYDGAFAGFCRVPARHLHDVSASPLSDVEIGAMPCAFGTAANLLARAAVSAGERVLVTGASGGVGLAAVQLATLRGAHVTAMASGPKQAAVRAAGAEVVLDRGGVPEPRAFEAVIDVAGGPGFGALMDALRPFGRYACSGAVAGPMVTADLRTIYLNDLTLHGCTFQPAEVFAGLVALINAGAVRPLVSRTYPLREIAAAQADLAARTHPGKLVLIPPEPAP